MTCYLSVRPVPWVIWGFDPQTTLKVLLFHARSRNSPLKFLCSSHSGTPKTGDLTARTEPSEGGGEANSPPSVQTPAWRKGPVWPQPLMWTERSTGHRGDPWEGEVSYEGRSVFLRCDFPCRKGRCL